MKSIPSLQSVNLFLLEKQHLLPRVKTESIERIVQDVVGLHATAATTPYLSLFARVTYFKKDHLDEALYDRSALAKLRCVRTTIYVHTSTNLPMVYGATSNLTQDASRNYMLRRGIDDKAFSKLSNSVLELLADEDHSATEIRRALDTELDVSALLYHMCDLGLLVRRKPIRSWRDRSIRYAPFSKYFPDTDLQSTNENEALIELVRYYLTAFGPTLEEDLLWWCGLPKRKVRQALTALQSETQTLEIAGLEGTHIMLQAQTNVLQQIGSDARGIVNLLPVLDSYLMGYKQRQRYLDPRHTNCVFDRSGNATSTILLDGEIIGVWDFEDGNPATVKLFDFEKTSPDVWEKVCAHARRMGAFIAGDEVNLQICTPMTPLPQRTAGGFMRPLKDP